ncbi:hypothetical protein BC835DRAFT_1409663 [Cytidiella melzeri]|nr:hypothetical protein BC835DRAFT_1409663 [Cytidiella melzeri]
MAGAATGRGKTLFEAIHDSREQQVVKDTPWAPFASEEEWGQAQWMMSSALSQSKIDKFLKLQITQNRSKLSFKDKRAFLKAIDALPRGPEWQCETFKLHVEETGGGEEDCANREVFELWKRNLVECICELLANPTFKDHLHYAPEQEYEDESGEKPILGEMWSEGATLVPLTIDNISKGVRRSLSSHGTVWIGYLPVAELESAPKAKRSVLAHQLFHDCMHSLLEPLVAAGREGVDVAYPIVAAYIVDNPEQCLITCCQENHCLKCLQLSHQHALEGNKLPGFAEAGLRAIHPFRAELPHCDIFACLTPDLLHQLHKGVFKDHTVKWATACVDGKEDEVNQRLRAMPSHPDLCHFKKGISLVSQWTGNEYKQMEKVFVGVVAGAADPDVVKAVRAVLDFVYYAHYEAHTEDSLSCLQEAWTRFHSHKHVFMHLGVRNDFNISKLHSMTHYVDSIRLFGTADGYNTEGPEHLHIDFAKHGYRASNCKQYAQQMTVWMDCQDAVQRFDQYIEWFKNGRKSQLSSGP